METNKLNNSVCAVIVTCNRGTLLRECLSTLAMQSLLPNEIIIIDNHSTDNTKEILIEDGYIGNDNEINCEFGKSILTTKEIAGQKTVFNYIFKNHNDGGAGGFYAGMKTAFEKGYDWIWMMDDDGKAHKNELEQLFIQSIQNNIKYSNALVIDDTNPNQLAFNLDDSIGRNVSEYKKMGLLYNRMNPFNGTFINREVIEKIGLIKRELFIWGDEMEYTNRVKSYGYQPTTICTAYHYHPSKLLKSERIIPFIHWGNCVVHQPIYYRNYGYINWKYNKKQFIKNLVIFSIYYGSRFQFKNLFDYFKYTYRGIRENWSSIPIQR